MALNIKHPEADRLARELAARTGETITEAVLNALRERLKRQGAKSPLNLKDEIMEISRRCAALPRLTAARPTRSSATTNAGCHARVRFTHVESVPARAPTASRRSGRQGLLLS